MDKARKRQRETKRVVAYRTDGKGEKERQRPSLQPTGQTGKEREKDQTDRQLQLNYEEIYLQLKLYTQSYLENIIQFFLFIF